MPDFLLALVLMYIGFKYFGRASVDCSPRSTSTAEWNLGKVIDLLAHLWVPVVVLGAAGTAGLIRVLRANLLDELHKPYVVAARARGMPGTQLMLKYPLRVALNPFVSTIGWVLPGARVGRGHRGAGAVAADDRPAAPRLAAEPGHVSRRVGHPHREVLTVIGTLISDILLAWLDPRVRLGYR